MTEPFLPFTRPSLDEATIQGVIEVLRSGWLASGANVAAFEAALSHYLGGRSVRVLTSATEALEIALAVCGIGEGDEVITPALSFAATANVIVRRGATPVFVDVELDTRNLDLDEVEAAIGPRTAAILPVHFAGLPADLESLYRLAERHELRVIEDAAHAIGSSCGGRRIGSFGDLACFSFHPNKNITSIEGGAIVGASTEELVLIERNRFHGLVKSAENYSDVQLAGGKSNLSDVAARVGLGQLPHLDEFNAARRELAARYFDRWRTGCPLQLPARGDEGHSWHIFAPLLPLEAMSISRVEFMERMRGRGIGVGVHYPALHTLTAYRSFGYREGMCPNAERIGRETVTLPLFPAMQLTDVDRVVDTVAEIMRGCT